MNSSKLGWIAAGVILAGFAGAQFASDAQAKRSSEILVKARQVDMVNQLLPLMLERDQIDKFMPVLEEYRKEFRKLEDSEFVYLQKLEPNLDKSLKDAYTKKVLPDRKSMVETFATFKTFTLRRDSAFTEYADKLTAVVNKTLNAGQKKTMMTSLRPTAFDPTIDPKEMSDDDKIKFFVQIILMDNTCYDVLLQMSKNMK